jgi:hypothetical protein
LAEIIVPIRLDRPCVVRAIKTFGGRGFPPPALGALVRTTDDFPEDVLLLSMEVPIQSLQKDVTKDELERACLARLISDLAARRIASWSVVGRGADPPDFIVNDNGNELGVELTSYTSAQRRQAHAEFRRVRADLLRVGPAKFEHLSGHLLYYWSHESLRPGSLVHRSDRSSIVDGLSVYRIAPPVLGSPAEPFRQVLPDPHAGNAEPWRYLATRWEGPPSEFFKIMGFDIGLCIESAHTATGATKELARLISIHDKHGCDTLVVQVGAPDTAGMTYATDEVIAELAIGQLRTNGVVAKHISTVLIHFWRNGSFISVPVRRPAS